jgi:hypothetical protein
MGTLEITNSAGTVTGTIDYPLELSATDRASAIGEMAFSVFVGSPGAASLAPGVYVRWTEGGYEFWGVVETVQRNEQEDGTAILAVACSDVARELVWRTAAGLELAEDLTPLELTVQAALDRVAVMAPGWVMTAGADLAGVTVYLAADGASVWTLLLSLADKLGVFIIRGAARTLTLTGTFTASGVTARSVTGDKPANVAPLLSLANDLSGREIVTEIVPFTAGNASVRLSLYQATAALPSGFAYATVSFVTGGGAQVWRGIQNTAAVAAHGTRQRVVQFPEISPLSNSKPDIVAAANALQRAAVQFLADHAGAQRVLKLVMDDASTIVGPLRTLIVQHGDLDGAFRVLEAAHTWAPNLPVRSTLMLNDGGQLPATGAAATVTSIEAARAYRSHAQLAPNVYQLAFQKLVDAQYSADFRFRFDTALTQLLFVALDVQLLPLQSTVRALGATGAKTSDHTQGNHGHTTTLAAHSHTVPSHTHDMVFAGHTHTGGLHTHGYTTIAHVHSIEVTQVSTGGSDFNDVRLNASAPRNFQVTVGTGAGLVATTPTTSTGGASTDTGNGGNVATGTGLATTLQTQPTGATATSTDGPSGAIASNQAGGFTHAHTVDVAVSMEYGIYRAAQENTFALADLEYQVNGGAWAGLGGAASLGDGWYRLEMTAALCDAITFTPVQLSNRISVRSVMAAASEESYAVGVLGSGATAIWNDAGTYTQGLSGAAVQALAFSPNGWLYRLQKAAGAVEVYQPDAAGTLALWDTWAITANTYNAICVDPRTGVKWWAGINGWITGYGQTLTVLGGAPTLTAIAAFDGYVYASGGTSIWRIGKGATIQVAAGTAAGQPMAAMSDGRIVQFSINTAAFQFRVWWPTVGVSVFYARSDAGNAWTPLSIASAANLIHVGCSDGRVRTYALDNTLYTATLIWTSTGTPGATGYPASIGMLGVRSVLSAKAATIDAQLTVRSVVQAIVMQ